MSTSNATQSVTVEAFGKIIMSHFVGMDRRNMPERFTWLYGHDLAKLGLVSIYSAGWIILPKFADDNFTALKLFTKF